MSRRRTEPPPAARWVFLADPGSYGWEELVRDGGTLWDGIRNAQAQQHLRSCAQGDLVLIYHTAPDRAIVGAARVVAPAQPDPADEAKAAVRIEPVVRLEEPVPMATLRADPATAEASFVRMPRVAVHPLETAEWDRILELSGTDPGVAADQDPATSGGP
jgi:predicted RNA-binding protein with PUA-like domain